MPELPESPEPEPESEPEAETDLDQRLKSYFLKDDDSAELRDLLLRESIDDPERVLHLAALNDLAEEGLDLLAAEGISHKILDVDSGRRMGGYRLIQEIGAGGMGLVFLAEDTTLGRLVALKLLSRAGSKTSERFRREAEITASLDHPNIVPVYGRGEDDGVEYLVMRYIAGKDIISTLEQNRGRDTTATQRLYDNVVSWMSDIARALHHAHGAGVLHRDVKPSNILVEKGTPFIVDFGLASQEEQVHLTQPGDMLGTVPYMSPEQIRGEIDSLDSRADVYSAGATLYHLLAGAVPFAGRSSQAVARQILTRDPTALRPYGVPRDLEAIVFRCLEKDRDRRYATASDLADDLDRFLDRRPVQARYLGPARRAFRTVLRHKKVALSALVLSVLLSVGGYALLKSSSDRQKAHTELFNAALAAGDRDQFVYATEVLEQLRDKGAEIDGLDRALSRMQKYALRDELMTLLYMKNSLGFYRPEASSEDEMEELLAQAVALNRPDVLSDHFRFIRIVVLKRLKRTKEADQVLEEWERNSGQPSLRTRLLTTYLRRKSGKSITDQELHGLMRDGEPRTVDDHYFAGLVLALFPGGSERGLKEIDRWLQHNPSNYWGRFIRGNLLRQTRRYSEAREVYSGLIANLSAEQERENEELDLKLKAAYYQRGILSARVGDFEFALDDFAKAGDFLGSWVRNRAGGHALAGLGRFEEAVQSYDAALIELRGMLASTTAKPKIKRQMESNLAAVTTEKGRAQMELGLFDAAEETFASIAHLPGRLVESEELCAFLLLERARHSSPDGLEGLRQITGEIQDMAEEHPESQRIKLMLQELRVKLGGDEERAGIVAELYAEEDVDPEFRMWRAWISFIFVEGRLRTFFDRDRPEDISQEHNETWTGLVEEAALANRRAADDLAVIQLDGFDRLEGIFRDAVMAEFLLASTQLWVGEVRQAAALYSRLSKQKDIEKRAWAPLMFALHGRALELLDLEREALAVYKRGLTLAVVDDWCLSYSYRLCVRNHWWDEFKAVLKLSANKLPHSEWLESEYNKPIYDEARKAGKLPG